LKKMVEEAAREVLGVNPYRVVVKRTRLVG